MVFIFKQFLCIKLHFLSFVLYTDFVYEIDFYFLTTFFVICCPSAMMLNTYTPSGKSAILNL